MSFSSYYQACIEVKDCWFLVAIMRSFEHLSFDRTVNKETSTFEFFVPEGNEQAFIEIMEYLASQGVVKEYHKMPNRLAIPGETL